MSSSSPSPLAAVQSAAADQRLLNPFYRKTQIKLLHDVLVDHAQEIQQIILQEGKQGTPAEAAFEFRLTLDLLAKTFSSIDPGSVLDKEKSISNGKDDPAGSEPPGIVIIEPTTTHALLYPTVSALAPAMAAGNCVVVLIPNNTLSSHATTLTKILQILQSASDLGILSTCPLDVFRKSVEVRDVLKTTPYIYVSQSQSQSESCSSDLPSQYLIFSLHSPSYSPPIATVSRDADIPLAASSLVASTFCLSGLSPWSPRLVLVDEWVRKDFLLEAVRCLVRLGESWRSFSSSSSEGGPRKKKMMMKGGGRRRRDRNNTNTTLVSFDEVVGGGIIEVDDRDEAMGWCFLEEDEEEEIKGGGERGGRGCPMLAIHAVTSMDAAIDFSHHAAAAATTSVDGRIAPAAYVFGSSGLANYVSQFLNVGCCFVNHVPTNLFFGPMLPINGRVDRSDDNANDHLSVYSVDQFTRPKQRFIQDAAQKEGDISSSASLFSVVTSTSAAPSSFGGKKLPEVERKKKRDTGFFDQALITMATLIMSTVVIPSVGVATYYGVGYVRRRIGLGGVMSWW